MQKRYFYKVCIVSYLSLSSQVFANVDAVIMQYKDILDLNIEHLSLTSKECELNNRFCTDYYYKDGMLILTNTYKDNKGTLKSYFNNKNVKSILNYKNNKASGIFQKFSLDGSLKENGFFIDGMLRGFYNTYEDGILQEQDFYLNNYREGLSLSYYNNKELKSKYLYTHGSKNGQFELYYKNGAIKARGYYKDNLQNGSYFEYDTNGLPSLMVNYKNGLKDGRANYYINGDMQYYIIFSKDKAFYLKCKNDFVLKTSKLEKFKDNFANIKCYEKN